MVESEADLLSEDVMLGAVMFGHREMQPVIDMIIDLAEDAAKEPWDFTPPDLSAHEAQIRELAEAGLRDAYKEQVKQNRQEKITAAKNAAKAAAVADVKGATGGATAH